MSRGARREARANYSASLDGECGGAYISEAEVAPQNTFELSLSKDVDFAQTSSRFTGAGRMGLSCGTGGKCDRDGAHANVGRAMDWTVANAASGIRTRGRTSRRTDGKQRSRPPE